MSKYIIFVNEGLEFRALFISTVRNMQQKPEITEINLGFLSDPKLLNTALTRVKSHVAVVGNAKTLCSVGTCQKIWIKYLQHCGLYQAPPEQPRFVS